MEDRIKGVSDSIDIVSDVQVTLRHLPVNGNFLRIFQYVATATRMVMDDLIQYRRTSFYARLSKRVASYRPFFRHRNFRYVSMRFGHVAASRNYSMDHGRV